MLNLPTLTTRMNGRARILKFSLCANLMYSSPNSCCHYVRSFTLNSSRISTRTSWVLKTFLTFRYHMGIWWSTISFAAVSYLQIGNIWALMWKWWRPNSPVLRFCVALLLLNHPIHYIPLFSNHTRSEIDIFVIKGFMKKSWFLGSKVRANKNSQLHLTSSSNHHKWSY